MAAQLKKQSNTAHRMATRLLPEEEFTSLPVWQVTIQIRHAGWPRTVDSVFTIKWPGKEAPEIAAVMLHWLRYPRQFHFAAYLDQ